MTKKILTLILCFILTVPFLNYNTHAYSAVSYCLYDPMLNKVIASSDMNRKMAMASTTKIMTALLACELCDLDKEIKITDKMIAVEGSSIGLQVGDIISYECILYGLMLESGNDAALCIAIDISGSAKDFAVLMNEKAKQIGMKNTSFVTPNGLDDEYHYSTAYDMAILGGYAMQNELFRKIVGTKQYKSIYNNGETYRIYYNHNRLLSSFSGVDGIKTGFTKKAGRCLVSSCVRNGVRLIAVTLNAGDDWNDHKSLYNYGFKQYEQVALSNIKKYIKVTGGTVDEIKVESKSKNIYFYDGLYSYIKTKVHIPKFLYAPIKKGDVVGYVEFFYNGTFIDRSEVIALESVKIKTVKQQNKPFCKKIFENILLMLKIK